jgi:hypothetical protein
LTKEYTKYSAILVRKYELPIVLSRESHRMSKDAKKSFIIPIQCSLVVTAENEAEAKIKAKRCIQSIGMIGGVGVRIYMEAGEPIEQVGGDGSKKDKTD